LEVQHTEYLAGTETVWLATPGEIIRGDGTFIFEDEASSPSSKRLYRVVEKRCSSIGLIRKKEMPGKG
jgi:hypothetical protein